MQQVNKDLIISLILKDLKHNQLTVGLRRAGLDADLHNLEILDVVARLMDIPKGEVSDQWSEVYFSFLEQAPDYEITELGEALQPLAEECYKVLLACQQLEKRAEDYRNRNEKERESL